MTYHDYCTPNMAQAEPLPSGSPEGAQSRSVQVAADGSGKVTIEVIQKSEGVSPAVLWTVALMFVIAAVVAGFMFFGGDDGPLGSSSGSGNGNCADGIDNDAGGQADRGDPDCYSIPDAPNTYDPDRRETNSANG